MPASEEVKYIEIHHGNLRFTYREYDNIPPELTFVGSLRFGDIFEILNVFLNIVRFIYPLGYHRHFSDLTLSEVYVLTVDSFDIRQYDYDFENDMWDDYNVSISLDSDDIELTLIDFGIVEYLLEFLALNGKEFKYISRKEFSISDKLS